MSEIKYYSEEGLQKLRDELHHLIAFERPAASAAIAEARDKGDLSENAEYDAAKEAQGHLEARISKLQDLIANVRLRFISSKKVIFNYLQFTIFNSQFSISNFHSRHYHFACLLNEFVALFAVLYLHFHWFVHHYHHIAREKAVHRAAHNFVRVFDGYGQNGQSEVERHLEGAVFERRQVIRVGACAFGEDCYRRAVDKFRLRLLQTAVSRPRRRAVDVYVLKFLASVAQHGHFAQLFLHYPAEIDAQIGVERNDVERALMVGHHYVRLVLLYILATDYFDSHKHQQLYRLCPKRPYAVRTAYRKERNEGEHCHRQNCQQYY